MLFRAFFYFFFSFSFLACALLRKAHTRLERKPAGFCYSSGERKRIFLLSPIFLRVLILFLSLLRETCKIREYARERKFSDAPKKRGIMRKRFFFRSLLFFGWDLENSWLAPAFCDSLFYLIGSKL